MKRRVSSRDDLFLSALDMYTLLSLVLIGFAFVVSRAGADDERLVDLPTYKGPTSADKPEDVLTVEWSNGTCDCEVTPRAYCKMRADPPKNLRMTALELMGPQQELVVPCCPQPFYKTAPYATETDLEKLKQLMGEPNPSVAIACHESDPIGCFRLQWVMADADFSIRAVTKVK